MFKCTGCKKILSINNFYKSPNRRGYVYKCKKCLYFYYIGKSYNGRSGKTSYKFFEKDTEKFCTRCGKFKLLEQFYKSKTGRKGVRPFCIPCNNFESNKYNHQLKAPDAFTKKEWEDLKKLYNYSCLMCNRQEPEITLTIDHIIPSSKLGTNDILNIQPLCRSCNSSKGNRIVINFRRTFGIEKLRQIPENLMRYIK